ncbi:leucine-rich repeat and immunoglobulin-like domain-containing nogo receptor-interacting protein 4 [Ostrea edulis]|uniref:leucine-rich repeat and immunoglobulin-like domain-containing nogo receptor-interacting protein 4 n=1 Tax=Ostrea edulis TaxID=37623 RepID=UPI0024AF2B19|nr:leucine-rich repeat and immunoglobulin-like domain-containing nogo receptor-interacting protein 4 [Ostrea edulis]
MYSWTLWILVSYTLICTCVTGTCPYSCRCYKTSTCNGTKVNCRWGLLTRVPTGFPNDTCYIDLGWNRITTMGNGTFLGLTSLQTLDMGWNGITTMGNGTFLGLTSLQTLDLQGNGITTIGNGPFVGLTSLQTLDLRWNGITTMGNGTFLGLTSLQTLDLYENAITTVENGAFIGLTSLQTLQVYFIMEIRTHQWSIQYALKDLIE